MQSVCEHAHMQPHTTIQIYVCIYCIYVYECVRLSKSMCTDKVYIVSDSLRVPRAIVLLIKALKKRRTSSDLVWGRSARRSPPDLSRLSVTLDPVIYQLPFIRGAGGLSIIIRGILMHKILK